MILHQVFDVPELKAADAGRFTGYAAVFGNLDRGGDRILPGAFAEIKRNAAGFVKIFNQHDSRDPIGVAKVEQDSKGLAFDGRLVLEVPSARAAHALMKAGALDAMSIGYEVLPGGEKYERDGTRTLSRLRLHEISPVSLPMNEAATIDNVKAAAPATLREFETLLVKAGFSRRRAQEIAVRGFDAGAELDDDTTNPEDLQALHKSLAGLSLALKGKR